MKHITHNDIKMAVLVICGQVIQIILILSKSAQTVILLTCTQWVPGSNIGSDTDYPDRCFSWFYKVSPGKHHNSTLN